ncbi:MAG: hypothetical protein M4579_004446 [Chaenotheca gracillima]|nr:MAG: hypothetical protein M4579_004446 [Chaenotheca gracillima]
MQALEAGRPNPSMVVVHDEKNQVGLPGADVTYLVLGSPTTDRLSQSQLGRHHLEQSPHSIRQSISDWRYGLKTLWLFTYSEHKTVVYPSAAFGIFAALSGPVLTTNPSPSPWDIFGARVPRVIFYCWLNILAFTVSNQRHSNSVVEDSINKPWRPLPSGRISVAQTRRLLLAIIPTLLIATLFLGGATPTLYALALTWMYNELGGADESFVIRNLLNACGLVSYAAGASEIASGIGNFSLNSVAYSWLAIVAAIIATTLQVQDLRDQEGDRTRDRSTCPLVFGDGCARWMCAVPIFLWSFACPAFWELGVFGYVGPVLIGTIIAARALSLRNSKADEITWKLWGLWMTSIYVLPLWKDYSIFFRFAQ